MFVLTPGQGRAAVPNEGVSTNEKRREQEVHRWIGVVPAVPVLVIRESVKSEVADLLVDLCSTLTYAHELWAVTKRMRVQIQAMKMTSL